MPTNQNNNSTFEFIKTLLLSAALAVISMLLIALLVSVAIGGVKNYEKYYPLISVILQALPPFISMRITSRKYDHALFFVALAQGFIVLLMLLSLSLILNGADFSIHSLIRISLYTFIMSFAAILFPRINKKRIK